jgi:hypothetical protein
MIQVIGNSTVIMQEVIVKANSTQPATKPFLVLGGLEIPTVEFTSFLFCNFSATTGVLTVQGGGFLFLDQVFIMTYCVVMNGNEGNFINIFNGCIIF